MQILDGSGFYFYHRGEQRLQLMRRVCLSHKTSVANTLLKAISTKLLPALESREKYRGGGRGEEALGEPGTVHRNLMFAGKATCLKSSQEPSATPSYLQGFGGKGRGGGGGKCRWTCQPEMPKKSQEVLELLVPSSKTLPLAAH